MPEDPYQPSALQEPSPPNPNRWRVVRKHSAFVFALSVAALILAIIALRIEMASQMEAMANMSPDQLAQRILVRTRIVIIIGVTIIISGGVAFITSIRIALLNKKRTP